MDRPEREMEEEPERALQLVGITPGMVVADVGAALSVPVPRELEPPLTLAGLSVSELSVTPVGAVTVSVAPSVAPYVAEIVTF